LRLRSHRLRQRSRLRTVLKFIIYIPRQLLGDFSPRFLAGFSPTMEPHSMDISSFWSTCNWTRERPSCRPALAFSVFPLLARFLARFLAEFWPVFRPPWSPIQWAFRRFEVSAIGLASAPKMRLSKAGSTFPRWPVFRPPWSPIQWTFRRFGVPAIGLARSIFDLGCPIVFDRW
jgi:hypothetical protein